MAAPRAQPASRRIDFAASSRNDVRVWLLLLFGAVFAYAGLTIDPATNCGRAGDCTPILVPLAAVVGVLALVGSSARLWANHSRGSRLDLTAGTLSWWQDRRRGTPGHAGSIALADIGLVSIRRNSESSDDVRLFDKAGVHQPYFDAEVLPSLAEAWCRQLVTAQPHIRLDVVE